jgi:hypothetical protein
MLLYEYVNVGTILLHVVPLLGNDREITSHTKPSLGNGRNRHERNNGKTVGAVFSARSVLRLYNEGQLPLEESLETGVRRVGGWCEMAASLGGSGLWGVKRTAAVQSL